jgi:hypothetical protein
MSDPTKPASSKGIRKESTPNCMHPGNDQLSPQRHVDITAMIRSLQRTEGLTDCFRSGLSDCDQLECAWRQYCLEHPDPTHATKSDA